MCDVEEVRVGWSRESGRAKIKKSRSPDEVFPRARYPLSIVSQTPRRDYVSRSQREVDLLDDFDDFDCE